MGNGWHPGQGDAAQVTPQSAVELLGQGAVLLDVREPVEWAAGHAPQAVHLPMTALQARAHELPTDRTIVCVCHVGARSAAVSDALNRSGWNAVNLAGGMQAWAEDGFDVVTDAGTPGVIW
jgi:rhodanese-related sulfurtransferase